MNNKNQRKVLSLNPEYFNLKKSRHWLPTFNLRQEHQSSDVGQTKPSKYVRTLSNSLSSLSIFTHLSRRRIRIRFGKKALGCALDRERPRNKQMKNVTSYAILHFERHVMCARVCAGLCLTSTMMFADMLYFHDVFDKSEPQLKMFRLQFTSPRVSHRIRFKL